MTFKSIEVYYDIDRIPGTPTNLGWLGRHPKGPDHAALDFRNDAIELIEDALLAARAGEWEGAEIGMGEVNFGFAVDDFDQAEAIVRKTVAGTKFEHFREIVRNEFDMADLV